MKLATNGRTEIVNYLTSRFRGSVPTMKHIVEYAEELLSENLKFKNLNEDSRRYTKRKLTLYERAFRNVHLYCQALSLPSPFGYVYVISNPAWAELKIGSSKDAESRLSQYNTYSPKRDFKLEYYILVPNYKKVEKSLQVKFNADGEWVNT